MSVKQDLMKKRVIREVIARKSAEIAVLCKAVSPAFNKEDIHEFRVSIKVLRAFLTLQRQGKRKSAATLPKKLRQLYGIAGSIREAQLGLAFLSEKGLPRKLYVDRLIETIEKGKAEWAACYAPDALDRLFRKLEHKNYDPSLWIRLRILLRDCDRGIVSLSTDESLSDKRIHAIRKKIKCLLHVIALTEREWLHAHQLDQQLPMKALHDLAEAIGTHHDACVHAKFVRSLIKGVTGKSTRNSLVKIEEDLARQMRGKREDIRIAAHGILLG